MTKAVVFDAYTFQTLLAGESVTISEYHHNPPCIITNEKPTGRYIALHNAYAGEMVRVLDRGADTGVGMSGFVARVQAGRK